MEREGRVRLCKAFAAALNMPQHETDAPNPGQWTHHLSPIRVSSE